MHIIGIDFSTEPEKVGIALAKHTGKALHIFELQAGENPNSTVLDWLKCSRCRGHDVLLAIDAPLGWPNPLRSALTGHKAGDPIDASGDAMFSRATDAFVRRATKKKPLEVGANLIARTALAALKFLGELRSGAGMDIPLAWSPTALSGAAVIEVYPASTLKAHGLPSNRYKGNSDEERENRAVILGQLQREAHLHEDNRLIALNSADALDAVVCALAGADFLCGEACFPDDLGLAKVEGWIWTKPSRPTLPRKDPRSR